MYIVLEIQTNAEGVISTLVYQFDNLSAANNKYHTILAAAAVSGLPAHTAVIMTNDGATVKAECYKNGENITPVL